MTTMPEASVEQWRQFWLKTTNNRKKTKNKKGTKTTRKNKKLQETRKIHDIHLHINN